MNKATTFTCDTCGWIFPLEQIAWDEHGYLICPNCARPKEERDAEEKSLREELDRLRDGIGTPDELADYAATRRDILSGE